MATRDDMINIEAILEKSVKPSESYNEIRAIFLERQEEVMNLVQQYKIKKYLFKPSGRTIWVVTGRRREYQIIPSSNYCSCDDFYFRVMSHKKPLCYHLIAQRIAAATNRFRHKENPDTKYNQVIHRIKLKQ